MKKSLLLLLFLSTGLVHAQDYLSGKIQNSKTPPTDVLYDRTQSAISSSIFQTIYKIVNKNKKQLYSIILTHDRVKSVLLVSIKPETSSPYGVTVTYKKNNCGLIFNDNNPLDTVFNIYYHYEYLLSFTDTTRDYPLLHKIKTWQGDELILDPLSKLRIRKHTEIVSKIIATEQEITKQNSFNQQLLRLRDSLYAKQSVYNEKASQVRKLIEADVAVSIKDKKVSQDEKKYIGDKRFDKPHGKGLLVVNGNIYDGNFKEGRLVSGNAALRNDAYEYYGEYNADNLNGTGWQKFTNGSYQLGLFTGGEFVNGIALQKNKDGETYFGGYNGKRNGYGELQNTTGGKYAGEFADNRLIKGYSKEVDPFGYYTYSRIESGNKTAIDAKIAEEFFGLTLTDER